VLEGIYVANLTPFRSSGAIDQDAYLAHVGWLAEAGVSGVVPFGTNGEGPSVAMGEKMPVIERLFGFPDLEIIPCVGQGNLPDTLEMVRALDQLPAAGVLVLPPYFFKPVEPDGLRRFYAEIIGATRHPVLAYNIPAFAVEVPVEVVLDVPLWGAKDSGEDRMYGERILAGGKGVLYGAERWLWERLVAGAPGIISGLANFMPEAFVELLRLVKTGDDVSGRELSDNIEKVRAVVKRHTGAGVTKVLAQTRHGVSMGTVRPPLGPAPPGFDPVQLLELAGVGVNDGPVTSRGTGANASRRGWGR
jgi:4-hydroxy-tetrahydrodipicolinate synthase